MSKHFPKRALIEKVSKPLCDLHTPGTTGEGGFDQKEVGVRVVSNKIMPPLRWWHF